MDWLRRSADWMRELLARQDWLAPVRPMVESAPDWALLGAGPAVLVLIAALWTLLGRKKRTAQAQVVADHEPPWVRKAQAGVAQRGPTPAGDEDEASRSVRVFVSSTFLDMQRERDILVKETFPALRTRLRARGVELFEVDLRWGVNREDVETGRTLAKCLISIDACRPYFIGILGERYGTMLHIDEKVRAAFPTLAHCDAASVTECEVVHGVLSDRNAAAYALFFERDADWLNSLAPAERKQFEGEDAQARSRQKALKARVRESGAQVVRYGHPHSIGAAVEAALGALIERRFPEAPEQGPFEQTAHFHAAYARDRRGLHVGAEAYIGKLDRWAEDASAPAMLISGPSGGGKSTLIANWAGARRRAKPGDIVFEHYISASPESADPVLLMRRLWEHLNRATADAVEPPAADAQLMDLSAALAQRLARASAHAERKGAAIFLVLDGLDKLAAESGLRWLPSALPPRVKLLASSLDGEAKSAARARGWAEVEILPLNDEQRRRLIDETLRRWQKSALEPSRVGRIVAHPLGGSPLFLKTILDELRYSAIEARLDERLDAYLGARDMPDLFARMLARLEDDADRDLVSRALSLIWASRAGIEEADLVAMVGATPLAWATLRNGMGDSLRDQAGRMTFGHDFMRQAVAARYLAGDRQRAAHLAIAGHFAKRAWDARAAEELPFQLRAAEAWDQLQALLLEVGHFHKLRARGDVELLSYWLPLQQRGADPETLLCAAFNRRAGDSKGWSDVHCRLATEIAYFLRNAGARGEALERLARDSTAASTRLLGAEDRDTLATMHELALTLRARGDFAEAQALQERVFAAAERAFGPQHAFTLTSMANLATTLWARGELAAARALGQRALDAKVALFGREHAETLSAAGNLATTLFDLGEIAAAHALYQQTLGGMKRVFGPEHPDTLACMHCLAQTLQAQGDLAGAQQLFEEVLAIRARLFGSEHHDALASMNNLAGTLLARGDLDRAQDLQARALDIARRVLGEEHPDTLASTATLAAILRAKGDLNGARSLDERAAGVMARVLGPEHPNTLTIQCNLVVALYASGELARAHDLATQVLAIATRTLGADHVITQTAKKNLAAVAAAGGG